MRQKKVRLLYSIGRPFAPLYGAIMTLRAFLYRKGLFKKRHPGVPVISVGNLTMGGTGKTPMTVYLAELLREKNPVIVSRGYRGGSSDKINVVSDRDGLLMDAKEAGDESYLLADKLPGVPVVTGPNKRLAAEYAVIHFNPGLVIVDDGFQHLALRRDLDMVLFKVDSFLGNNRVFPGGDMREPLKALNRADCFVLNCVNEGNQARAKAIEKALEKRFPGIPVFTAAYRPTGIVDRNNGQLTVKEIRGKKYFGFCGLADPSYFQQIIENNGIELTGFQVYPDHHFYSEKDLQKITDAAESTGAEGLITTEKDMVKLRSGNLVLPVLNIPIELVPFEGFNDFIRKRITVV